MTNIHIVLHSAQNELQQQKISLANELLEVNELCLFHMAQKINDLKENESVKHQTIKSRENHIEDKDYQVLQEAVQKAQQQIRKHIGIQHQMKICLEQVEDQLDDLSQKNDQLKKENVFLKKELSLAKKKQIQVVKKLTQTEEKIQYLEQRQRLNKPSSKINTEPEAVIIHDTSRKSLKKSFDSQKQKNLKKPLLSKGTGAYSKLGSRKTSKLGLLQNQIDVNLHNFITLSTHIKRDQNPATKTQGKQVFWNKRLKKKDLATAVGAYADYSTIQNTQNRSLNISPKQFRKQLKEKQLKDVYATNSREFRKSYQPAICEEVVTKKKQGREYSNSDAYQIKRTTIGHGPGQDRSKSVVY